LIDEDPEQPEICQVWFEVKTSKTCNWHPNIPLAVLEKDFSTRENLTTKSEEWRVINSIFKTNINELLILILILYRYFCRDVILTTILFLNTHAVFTNYFLLLTKSQNKSN